jgi:hypothetical protein
LAAEQRHRIGMGFMSAFYESGNTVVDRDRAEALKWAIALKAVELDARVDIRETEARIARIKAEMTPREIAEGEARARAWLAAHPGRGKR